MTLSSSKQRTTWAMASVSRMLARNLLPSPSPLEAPSTRPAMSTNSMVVGNTRSGLTMADRASSRGSGMGTIPLFGSMVQNGKFSALMPALVSALNRVDLPTLGSPTIPQLNPILVSSAAVGGENESGFEAVQALHDAGPVTGQHAGYLAQRFVNAGIQRLLFCLGRTAQYITCYLR